MRRVPVYLEGMDLNTVKARMLANTETRPLRDFVASLAPRLKSLDPDDMALDMALLARDVDRGRDGFTGEPLLPGIPPNSGQILLWGLTGNLEAYLDADLAAKVRAVMPGPFGGRMPGGPR